MWNPYKAQTNLLFSINQRNHPQECDIFDCISVSCEFICFVCSPGTTLVSSTSSRDLTYIRCFLVIRYILPTVSAGSNLHLWRKIAISQDVDLESQKGFNALKKMDCDKLKFCWTMKHAVHGNMHWQVHIYEIFNELMTMNTHINS